MLPFNVVAEPMEIYKGLLGLGLYEIEKLLASDLFQDCLIEGWPDRELTGGLA